MKEIKLGKVMQLELTAVPSFFTAFILMWGILSWCGAKLFRFSWRAATIGAFAGTLLHYASDLWHHAGHAYAARTTGFPMRGVRFWGVLGSSIYPDDEPTLGADMHIQRAVGGPMASALLSLMLGVLVLVTRPLGGIVHRLLQFLFADNLLVFTMGAFFPLKWTDGGTILHWWPQRNRQNLVIK